jgi:hypothetical protein
MDAVTKGSTGSEDRAAGGGETIGIDAAGKVLQDIIPLALDARGDVAPDAASLLGLRREASRDTELRKLVAAVAPRHINPKLWLRWMAGGEEPYAPARLSRAGSDKHASGRIMDRASERIKTQRGRRDKAQAKLEQAQRELDIEEGALVTAQAMDNAIVQWVVSEHLARIIGPVFAMGPAWTLMRICSAHVSDEDVADELAEVDPENHDALTKMLFNDRAEISTRILDALDLWSGHAEFEHAVRLALDDVVKQFADRTDERVVQREFVRSAGRMADSARPSAAMDREGVLDGFGRD